jgi:hypothetical protein
MNSKKVINKFIKTKPEDGSVTKETYTREMERNGKHGTFIELQALANILEIWICLYMNDTRYETDRWIIVQGMKTTGT